MAHEVLDGDHPPPGGSLDARPPKGLLGTVDVDSVPMMPSTLVTRAAGSAPPRRHTALVSAALLVVLGLGGLWNAHQSNLEQQASGRARTIVPDGSELTTELTGPTSEPILLLHNGSHYPVRVGVDPSSAIRQPASVTSGVPPSRSIDAIGADTTLATDPGLPVVLFADQTIAVLLRVRLPDCRPAFSRGRPQTLLLTGAPIPLGHTVPRTESTLVDLRALVDAERQRLCG